VSDKPPGNSSEIGVLLWRGAWRREACRLVTRGVALGGVRDYSPDGALTAPGGYGYNWKILLCL